MSEINIKDVLRRIDVRIAELGMTKTQFYELSGISSANFSQWNTKTHTPSKKKLAQAASVLKVSLEYLLYGTETKKPVVQENNGPREETKEDILKDIENLIRSLTPAELADVLSYAQFLVSKREQQ